MATLRHRRSGTGLRAPSVCLLIVLYMFAVHGVRAQPPAVPANGDNGNGSGSNNSNPNYFTSTKFNPSMAIIIVVLISAFFFLGFFSIYIRQCGGDRMDTFAATAAAAVGARSRRHRGLDSTLLETFPTLVYSEVKEHKIGKGALECAICLNEFEDDDTIRLLPKCDHVFHQDCVDAWLATHVTCPVCRTNYAEVPADSITIQVATDVPGQPVATDGPPVPEPAPAATDHVVISVDDEERKQEIKELARIASKLRGNGSRRPRRFPRSHSTGHSMTQQGESMDRYTLRLPDNVRKEIIAAGKLQRARSLVMTSGSEGTSNKLSRGIGEGSSRRGRSIRLGRSDRWPSFFVRSLSTKIPAWGNWRRGEEGSVKEGSVRGKLAAGRWSKQNSNVDSAESSTAALNRV